VGGHWARQRTTGSCGGGGVGLDVVGAGEARRRSIDRDDELAEGGIDRQGQMAGDAARHRVTGGVGQWWEAAAGGRIARSRGSVTGHGITVSFTKIGF
jgi:hypothetical protein